MEPGHKQALVQMQQNISVLLEKRKTQIKELIGDDRRTKRLVASALIAAAENANIAQCDPRSIFRSVVQAAMLNIDLANGLGEGWLVPFKGQCTLMPGYRGWMRRAQQEGFIVHSDAVYEHDRFVYKQAPKTVEHEPRIVGDRGKFIGSYAVAYKDGAIYDAVFVFESDIAKAETDTPAWRTWPDRMRRKLAISRLCKDLPFGQALTAKMIQVDADAEQGGAPDPDIDDMTSDLDLVTALPPPPEPGPQSKTQEILAKRRKSPIGDKQPTVDPKTGEVFDYGPPPMTGAELAAIGE